MIPAGFEWLNKVGTLPKMVTTALSLYGIHEAPGSVNNPTIMAWARETGLNREGYSADAIPWCGLFMALVALRSGYYLPGHPLWALNWLGFGAQEHQPCLGDVVVFLRPGGGHVGLYLGEDDGAYAVLGGNTADAVGIAWIEKTRLQGARAPLYKIGRPASSRPYILKRTGELSENEA
jgi:uncharacterized protein (TIGR02594 family)